MHLPCRSPSGDTFWCRELLRSPVHGAATIDTRVSSSLGKHLSEYGDVVERFDQLQDEAGSVADYSAIIEGLAPICESISAKVKTASKDVADALSNPKNVLAQPQYSFSYGKRALVIIFRMAP